MVMQWLLTNWFWVLIGVAFFAMHIFGHGGHGGHGRARPPSGAGEAEANNTPDHDVNRSTGGHHH